MGWNQHARSHIFTGIMTAEFYVSVLEKFYHSFMKSFITKSIGPCKTMTPNTFHVVLQRLWNSMV